MFEGGEIMKINKEKIRTVGPELADYFTALMTKKPWPYQILETDVVAFCRPCNNLKGDGGCGVLNLDDQARCAIRNDCGRATVQNVRGVMTARGLVPYE